MKLADRCRKEARDFYLYDNKDCVEWKAADLLDECERALAVLEAETSGGVFMPDGRLRRTITTTLAKLRSQEKADE